MESNPVIIDDTHFNREELLEKIDSDLEVVELLFESVRGQVPDYISSIAEVVERYNSGGNLPQESLETLRFASHSIKGSAYNICFNRLGNIAKAIEMTARERGNPHTEHKGEMLPHLFVQLTDEWSLVLSTMKG